LEHAAAEAWHPYTSKTTGAKALKEFFKKLKCKNVKLITKR